MMRATITEPVASSRLMVAPWKNRARSQMVEQIADRVCLHAVFHPLEHCDLLSDRQVYGQVRKIEIHAKCMWHDVA